MEYIIIPYLQKGIDFFTEPNDTLSNVCLCECVCVFVSAYRCVCACACARGEYVSMCASVCTFV